MSAATEDGGGRSAASAYALRKSELRRYLRAVDPRRPVGRRFVLYAHYRTGSHLLTELLNCHPRLHCEIEVLIEFLRPKVRRVLFPKLFLRGCLMSAPRDIDVFGINLKSDQLIRAVARPPRRDPTDFLRWLDRNGWQIIYLYRDNVVRQAISNEIANARLLWHTTSAEHGVAPKVSLDAAHLLRVIRWFAHSRKAEQRSLEGIPCLTLTYEADLLDAACHAATARRAFAFLGLEGVDVAVATRRLAADRLEDSLENYDAIARSLEGSEYAALLREP